jgi:hypothetical protein
LALLAKRKHEIEASETSSKQADATTKADPGLLEVIESLGKVTEKARRDMSNLVAGKKRPEQAFAK